MKKRNITDFTIAEFENFLEEKGEKKFRAQQVFNWVFNYLVDDYDDMKNVSAALRNILKEEIDLYSLKKIENQFSDSTKTKKYLFETFDNKFIESVIIPEEKRTTLCLSTQVGCPLDCKFCATGLMGYKRNLTAGEIIDQYLLTAKEYGKETITNIVYMGMGEPLLNFDNTVKSLFSFTGDLNKGLTRNRITVSTSGIPQRIRDLADTGLRVKIALSLHSAIDEIRDKIMPINIKYNLESNIEALKYYAKTTGMRITFEYLMLENMNDRDADVKALARLCSQLPSKINIIPFNSIAHMDPDGFSATLIPTKMNKIHEFVDKLRNKNITVMLRNTQGDDIAAACGQLAVKK